MAAAIVTVMAVAIVMTVLVAVVIAGGGSRGLERTSQQRADGFVSAALHARVDGHAHLRKRHTRALAHAAADQRIHARLFELGCQGAVARFVALEDAFGLDAIFMFETSISDICYLQA